MPSRTFTWDDPAEAMAAAASMSGLELWQAIADGRHPKPPLGAAMDFTVPQVEHGHLAIQMVPSGWMLSPLGTVHGGVTATAMDTVLGSSIHTTLEAGVGYATVDLNVTYLRPVRGDGGPIRADGEVIHVGGRVATSSARMVDVATGKLLATGTTTCLILR